MSRAKAWIGGALGILCITQSAWSEEASSASQEAPKRYETAWRSGTTHFVAQGSEELIEHLERLAEGRDRHILVQLSEPLNDAGRRQLRSAGLELQTPLGKEAFFGLLSKDSLDAKTLARSGRITAVFPIEAGWKLDSRLSEAKADTEEGLEGLLAVSVQLHGDATLDEGRNALAAAGGQDIEDIEAIHGFTARLPTSRIAALAAEGAIQWIEPTLPSMQAGLANVRLQTQAENVQAAGTAGNPFQLSGAGINVMVWDTGQVDPNHPGLAGRVTVGDTAGIDVFDPDHGTQSAGVIAGDGSLGQGPASLRGMAPAAGILSYGFRTGGAFSFGDLFTVPQDLVADFTAAIAQGADLANSSMWSAPEAFNQCGWLGQYGITSQLIDGIVTGSISGTRLPIAWIAGNSNGSSCNTGPVFNVDTLGPPAGSKNPIVVGAVDGSDNVAAFSGRGPTDDGRTKPDLVAPGVNVQMPTTSAVAPFTNFVPINAGCVGSTCPAYAFASGTSFAGPAVAGLMTLLLEDYRAQFAGQTDPLPSTYKTLMAHNAADIGNAGPDFDSGWGSVRIEDTLGFMRSTSGSGQRNFYEGRLDAGETQTFTIDVTAQDIVNNMTDLKVTTAWDDPPASPASVAQLINDLDLSVVDPFVTTLLPWTLDPANPGTPAVRNQADGLNNVEQVFAEWFGLTPGSYQVTLSGTSVPQGPQTFSLAASPRLSSVCQVDMGNGGSVASLSFCGGDLSQPGGIATLQISAPGLGGQPIILVASPSLRSPPIAVATGGNVIPDFDDPFALVITTLTLPASGQLNLTVGGGINNVGDIFVQAVVIPPAGPTALELTNALRVRIGV